MNIIDRAINFVNPKAGLKRTVARKQMELVKNSGYSHYGASKTKKSLRGWRSTGGSAREDIEENIKILRERSRDVFMGVPIANGALSTMRTKVVGPGLKVKPHVNAEILGITQEEAVRLNKQIEEEFNLWAESKDCDLERINNFFELQRVVFLNALFSGDAFTLLSVKPRLLMPYDLRIKLVEADIISTPTKEVANENIIDGVEVDEDGEVIAYHICNVHPLGKVRKIKKWSRISTYGDKTGRRNILHLVEMERIGQKRGVPALATVLESLKQLGRYTDAELVAAVISGFFTVFIETPEVEVQGHTGSVSLEDDEEFVDEDDMKLGAGTIIDLPEGAKANVANPGRPNTAFDPFVSSIIKQIGSALELPNEVLMKQFSASYSASRAALLEAWEKFKMQREWIISDFCQPIYEEWLCEAVAKGRIKAPGFFNDPIIKRAYSRAEWNGPTQGQLDPHKEVKAAEARVVSGFSTRSKEARELNGSDFDRNIERLKMEEAMMKEVRQIAEDSREIKKEEVTNSK